MRAAYGDDDELSVTVNDGYVQIVAYDHGNMIPKAGIRIRAEVFCQISEDYLEDHGKRGHPR